MGNAGYRSSFPGSFKGVLDSNHENEGLRRELGTYFPLSCKVRTIHEPRKALRAVADLPRAK
jgi:hypothetical protein